MPAELTLDTVLVASNSGLIASDLSDTETVMLDPVKGSYFGVQEVAKTIWGELAEPTSLRDVCATVAARYDIGEADVEADTLAFAQQLVDAGLAAQVD